MYASATLEEQRAIADASRAGIPMSAIADITGYSEGRVWQIVHDWQPTSQKGKAQQ